MTTATTIKTIWPNALALSHAAANLIVTESNKAVAEKGYFSIALSGGSTPKLLFELLAQALGRGGSLVRTVGGGSRHGGLRLGQGLAGARDDRADRRHGVNQGL